MRLGSFALASVIGAAALALPQGASPAAAACVFTTGPVTMVLTADCTTDVSILVPHGVTLDGAGNTITAVDPPGGHFVGGVIQNEPGATLAHVKNVIVTVKNLADVCDAGADRLRGIIFDGASGSIRNNSVINVTQQSSGCQEGNSIEVRKEPFDGTHPDTAKVAIEGNLVSGFMKSGIVCNGDVDCRIKANSVGASANQFNLAANGIQIAFGAIGKIERNHIAGNQWLGGDDTDATAILAFCPSRAEIRDNTITGNANVGIYADVSADPLFGCPASGVTADLKGIKVTDNTLIDTGIDGPNSDIGIYDGGTGNRIADNVVVGFETPTEADPEDDEIRGTRTRLNDDDDDDRKSDHRRKHRHGHRGSGSH